MLPGTSNYHRWMFGRRPPVENRVVASRMRAFFRDLDAGDRSDPRAVAERYGRHLFRPGSEALVDERKLSRSRFSVGIAPGDGARAFDFLTRRAVLICDTLLLSHNWVGEYHELGVRYREDLDSSATDLPRPLFADYKSAVGGPKAWTRDMERNNRTHTYGLHCPDLEGLGRWILDSEPLLTAGLAWYLPSYALSEYRVKDGLRSTVRNDPIEQIKAVDVIVRNGRVIDASGVFPVKNHLVREVLRAEIPFVDGVALRDFGRITVDEFDSYSAFRDFLRQSLLSLDPALDDVRSDHALARIGLEINDGLRSVRADLERARRKRAVAVSGAVLGSVSAVLVAVYGPALAGAIAAVGAGGGLWGVVSAMAENSGKHIHESKWYYVWALKRHTQGTG
jgi:hypothetical protein